NRRDVAEVREEREPGGAFAAPNPFEALDRDREVFRMTRQDRLVELDLGGSPADQTRDLLPEGGREVERERLLRTIGLVIRKGREREGTGQDGFHGRLRVRLGELPFVPADRLFPGDRSAHDRLTVIRVRVEIPNESANLDERELPREHTLHVLPGTL